MSAGDSATLLRIAGTVVGYSEVVGQIPSFPGADAAVAELAETVTAGLMRQAAEIELLARSAAAPQNCVPPADAIKASPARPFGSETFTLDLEDKLDQLLVRLRLLELAVAGAATDVLANPDDALQCGIRDLRDEVNGLRQWAERMQGR